jgi:hypothetical protein
LVPSDSQIIEEFQDHVSLVSNSPPALGISLQVYPSNDQSLEQLYAEIQADPSVISIQETVLSNNRALSVMFSMPAEQAYIIQILTPYNNMYYGLQFVLSAADLEALNPLLGQIQASYEIVG